MNDQELKKLVKILNKIQQKRSQIENLQNKIEKLYEDIGNLRAFEKQLRKRHRKSHQSR